jgi:hypothetical protein
MYLISSEITEGRIQEQMKSDDFTHDNSKPNFVAEDPLMTSSAQNLKSNDFNNSITVVILNQMISIKSVVKCLKQKMS